MIRDRRKFHTIAFSSPPIKSISDVKDLMDKNIIKNIEKLSTTDSYLDIDHVAYYSEKRYSLAPEIDEIIVTLGDREYYEYSLYIIGFRLSQKYIILIAAPFLLMLKNIFDDIIINYKTNGIVYRVIKLKHLMDAIYNNRHLGGRIKITRIDMMIDADTAAYNISLRGPDVIHSNTFIKLRNALEGTGISLSARKCTLLYDDHEGSRFSLLADQFGNYSFYVGKGGRNLPWANNLFSYLAEESLIKETLAFPLIRQAEEDENDEDS